jgi:hypothetical protein
MRSLLTVMVAFCLTIPAVPASAAIDWSRVDQALGKPGSNQPGDVHKYALPRSDLQVTLDGAGPATPGFEPYSRTKPLRRARTRCPRAAPDHRHQS